jgi:hypothetical protein
MIKNRSSPLFLDAHLAFYIQSEVAGESETHALITSSNEIPQSLLNTGNVTLGPLHDLNTLHQVTRKFKASDNSTLMVMGDVL